MNKLIAMLFVALISLSTLSSLVIAQESAPEDFQDVLIEVDRVEVKEGQIIQVERGDDVEIRVQFKSNIDSERARVKAWIGGFEFGDVEDRTEIFAVEPGLIYNKFLNLDIPDDIELDEDEEFALHVEIFDNVGSAELSKTFKLGVRKERHKLNILDVIFLPSNTVEAGRALRAVVRVENLGEKKEDDVLVKLSVPELGISTKGFIDELVAEEDSNDDDEETSESTEELVLFIPKNAKSGEYTVEVEVEFSRGHETITDKRTILVEGQEETAIAKAIISVDMSSQSVTQGSEVPYKFMIANLGNQRTLYSAEVEGVGAWATSRVSPAFVSVDQGEAGEIFVFVKANENAPAGQQNFKVNIMSDGIKVKEVNLNANIVEKKIETRPTFENTQKALEIAFVILVIILVILGLVIAFRRVGKSEKGGEPETIEGQTYY